jgi:hypothetical protein
MAMNTKVQRPSTLTGITGLTATRLLYGAADGTGAQSSALTFTEASGTLSATILQATGMSATHVLFGGAGGVLTGSATCTFDPSTNRLNVGGVISSYSGIIQTHGNDPLALGIDGTTRVSIANATGNTTITPTWNAGGTSFTGLKVNATDTASAAGSLLIDLQLSSTSRFSVSKGGEIICAGATNGDSSASIRSNGTSGRAYFQVLGMTAGGSAFDFRSHGSTFAGSLLGNTVAGNTVGIEQVGKLMLGTYANTEFIFGTHDIEAFRITTGQVIQFAAPSIAANGTGTITRGNVGPGTTALSVKEWITIVTPNGTRYLEAYGE